MPMADVFSPRSSTFLIDNLLKPGVDKQSEKTTTTTNVTPLENLTNTSAHFRRASPSVFVQSSNSNSSSSSSNNGGGSVKNNVMNFHPAYRPSQQTTVIMPFPPVPRADDIKTNVTLGLQSSLPLESISYPQTPLESNSPAKKRKNRTNFTTRQIAELENRYKTQRYLAPHERATLARTLGLTDRQVKTWFQNRRMKEKRQATDSEILTYKGYSPESHSPTVTPTSVQHYYPTPSASGASQHPVPSLALPPPPSASATPAPVATASPYSSSAMAPPATSLPFAFSAGAPPATSSPYASSAGGPPATSSPYASSVGAPPAACVPPVSVAPPVSTPRTTVAMTANASSAPVFQPLSIAVPSFRYSSGLKQRGPGLLMIDTKRQVYTQ